MTDPRLNERAQEARRAASALTPDEIAEARQKGLDSCVTGGWSAFRDDDQRGKPKLAGRSPVLTAHVEAEQEETSNVK